jgi:hypothetical protein
MNVINYKQAPRWKRFTSQRRRTPLAARALFPGGLSARALTTLCVSTALGRSLARVKDKITKQLTPQSKNTPHPRSTGEFVVVYKEFAGKNNKTIQPEFKVSVPNGHFLRLRNSENSLRLNQCKYFPGSMHQARINRVVCV